MSTQLQEAPPPLPPPMGSEAPPARLRRQTEAAEGPIRLEVRALTKVFGTEQKAALELMAAGADKDEVQRKLGAVVGVDRATFEVRSGEIFVIMGLSGSGKSTIVRLLNRLIEPTSGEILLDGRDLAKMSKEELIGVRRRDMSMVFQSFALMPHLNALENAAFGLTVAGRPKGERERAAMEALEQVGLGPYARRYPREMSGGMQQRVGLARALANNPTIMLMDEAFSALDPLIRHEMQDELLRLQREHRRTIIFISHDLDEAMRIGDRIAIMRSGRVVQVGTPYDILREPADDYVRAFFRNVNMAKVLRAGDVARYEAANTIVRVPGELRPALKQLTEGGHFYGYVRDTAFRYQGIVSRETLERALELPQPRFVHAFIDGIAPAHPDALMHDILRPVAETDCPIPVVDGDGIYLGAISRTILLQTLHREG
jgi:glycine betaine/proline transport system ATP-binding protein